jgi:hypothetical protein
MALTATAQITLPCRMNTVTERTKQGKQGFKIFLIMFAKVFWLTLMM